MVMALIVLLGFGLLFMYASDETERTGRSIESVIASQAKDIEGYKSSISNGSKTLEKAPARKAASKELAGMKRDNKALQDEAARLTKRIEDGKAEIVRKNEEFEIYKDEYRAYARGKAKGETMDKLETLTGVVYLNVAIREVTPIGIQIRHGDGQKRIPFEELPESMKDRFQFDPKQKEKAIAAEVETQKGHDVAAEVADELASQKMSEQRAKSNEEAKERVRQEIVLKEGLIASLKEEIKGLESQLERAAADAAAARQAGKMHMNKSGSINSNIRSKQNRISILQAEIGQMKARL